MSMVLKPSHNNSSYNSSLLYNRYHPRDATSAARTKGPVQGGKLVLCESCKRVAYCSKQCQTIDSWKVGHTLNCAVLVEPSKQKKTRKMHFSMVGQRNEAYAFRTYSARFGFQGSIMRDACFIGAVREIEYNHRDFARSSPNKLD